MSALRNSLSRKLTVMNMLVSSGALLLASIAFFAYDFITFRSNLINSTSVQAHIIGTNAISTLIFNDPASAERTLSALRASRHIVYAGIYTPDGQFFSGYWRQRETLTPASLPVLSPQETEHYWFKSNRFTLVQTIAFQNKTVGVVYIASDLGVIYARLRSYGIILLVILSAALTTALALSRIAQRAVSEPILRLAETAGFVSRDKDYSIRVPATGDQDEVALLVDAFNEMLIEIQKRDSALQESEQQFRNLADSIPQLAWMAEATGELFWYNHRWYEFTGTTPEQMTGWGWQAVHDPRTLAEVLTKWRASLATGEPFEMIFPLRGSNGEFRDFLTLAMPVRDAQGHVARWFGTNTDITEQRRSAEALRQTEKLAATGRLAASIAHEINNPLEAVTNLVYLARKQPANVAKYLALADQELDRIAQITKNTLGFYRDSTSRTDINISQLLQEVLNLYNSKLHFKKITVRQEYAQDLHIYGFPGEIRQIFANLIANAIEALPANGLIIIRATQSWIPDGSHRRAIRITVFDNGTGIATEHRRRIFEPFYTTKKDVGTGLGLWLTMSLIAKHQGVLRMRSSTRPGNSWTIFSVYLPAMPITN